ncbi:hypothetical protein [Ralstonia pseudosolanacearum]|uniref:hypothetical protein n=1 Tax=Ralstonia pseudosolanacearum TaxID=1310165 RepID=UPI0026749439|nr:hypothetical protein [Ralstonia pseudosolanacearum]MDO3521847.1 hypothetical protein [Ralstonia pseudosolanacearum]MDO3547877.1 hypothetical protein [Ralstonia pseudosolanacearum]MDO3551179.1 hypothetical protein [Ralstonia pseudosolanacearum]MDO3566226.1 hypothetical protein [Ralstonia pseudosolanacearum]MDO3580900.1 hypothetical protein [Ralstonia pseudosolanacearum]
MSIFDKFKHRIGDFFETKLPDDFFEMQASPIFWHGKALELHRAAMIIANQCILDAAIMKKEFEDIKSWKSSVTLKKPESISSQFLLLAAFSMENIFKGIIVFREPGLVAKNKLTGVLKSHSLLKLAKHAKVQLTEDEEHFCNLASSASVNWGRYPTSTEADKSVVYTKVTSEAFRLFDDLFQRTSSKFMGNFYNPNE